LSTEGTCLRKQQGHDIASPSP